MSEENDGMIYEVVPSERRSKVGWTPFTIVIIGSRDGAMKIAKEQLDMGSKSTIFRAYERLGRRPIEEFVLTKEEMR